MKKAWTPNWNCKLELKRTKNGPYTISVSANLSIDVKFVMFITFKFCKSTDKTILKQISKKSLFSTINQKYHKQCQNWLKNLYFKTASRYVNNNLFTSNILIIHFLLIVF